ncbi:MAG: SDR family oxidoreductase, partial [Minisyncoccia bacterium]
MKNRYNNATITLMSLEGFKLENSSFKTTLETSPRVEKAREKLETPEKERGKESVKSEVETLPKKIFITGATGFVGSHTCVELLRQGHELTLLVRPQEGISSDEKVRVAFLPLCHDENEFLKLKEKVTVVSGDITEPNLGLEKGKCEMLKDFDEVIHLAAKLSFRESDRESVLQSNVSGTEQVLKFAQQAKAKKVSFVSTAYVSGNKEGVIKEELVPELSAPNFDNAYEKSKFLAEHKVAEWGAETKTPVAILRPSVVVSKDHTEDVSGYYGFAAVLAEARQKIMLSDTKVQIPCSQDARLDLISVDDVARTIANLSGQDPSSQLEVFHLTNPQSRNVREIFEKSLELIGLRNHVELVDKPIDQVRENSDKITREMLRKLKDLLPFLFTKTTFDTKNISEKTGGQYNPEQISDEFIENALHHIYTPDAVQSWINEREGKHKPALIPHEFTKLIETGKIEQAVINGTLALFKKAVRIILQPSGIPETQKLYAKEASHYDQKHHRTTAFNDERMREYSAHEIAEHVKLLPAS